MNEETCTVRHVCNDTPRPVKILIGSQQIDMACQCLLDQEHPRLSTTHAAIAKRLLDFVSAASIREVELQALWNDVQNMFEERSPAD